MLELASDAAARQIDDSVAAVLLEKKYLKEETVFDMCLTCRTGGGSATVGVLTMQWYK